MVIIAIEAIILGWQWGTEQAQPEPILSEPISIKNLNIFRTPKFVEDYWNESGLSRADVLKILDDQKCLKSKRDYYACASAVSSVAERLGYKIDPNGSILKVSNLVISQNEKELLSPWIKTVEDHKKKNSYISMKQIWQILEKNMPEKSKNLYRALAINSYLSIKKDPHTYILPKKMYSEIVAKADNKTLSLGIIVGKDNNKYFIRKVLSGSLAEQAGLIQGDQLISIDSHSVADKSSIEISELLKGEAGSTVNLEISRDQQLQKVAIYRKENIIPTVVSTLLESNKKIGSISLNKFSKNSCELVREHVVKLKKENIEGLIFDLRDNSGGQLDEAACILSLFIDRSTPFFKLKYFNKKKTEESYVVKKQKIFSGKLAVLVNRASASAAEIVAGVIQDLNRGIIVGEKTFGKGTFQEGTLWSTNPRIIQFETMGYFILPSGRPVQLEGVSPDIRVMAKGVLNNREEETYLYPIQIDQNYAKTNFKRSNKSKYTVIKSDCTTKEENILKNYGFDNDLQLLKAQSYIKCEG